MEDLLLLVHRMPYPPNKGDKVRSYHLLRHLASRYRVHLGTFVDDASDWQHVDKLREWCGETCFARLDPRWARVRSLQALIAGSPLAIPYYFDRGLSDWIDDLMKRVPITRAVVFSSPMAQYVEKRTGLETIVDFVDVDSSKWTQYAEVDHRWYRYPLRWLYRREGKQLLAFERKTAALSKASVFVTKAEAALFEHLAPESAQKIVAVENGVDTEFFSPAHAFPDPYRAGAPVLVFTGAMDYRPNIDAVGWFVRSILPQIRVSHPLVRFCIVGARPSAEVEALAKTTGVIVTGTVADVRPYLAHAAISVAPIRVARGIQNKALEAMAMARAVVITSASSVALNAESGVEFCVADGPSNFAQVVTELLSDPERAARIGAAARDCVERNYSWERNLSRLDRYFGQADVRYASRPSGRSTAEPDDPAPGFVLKQTLARASASHAPASRAHLSHVAASSQLNPIR